MNLEKVTRLIVTVSAARSPKTPVQVVGIWVPSITTPMDKYNVRFRPATNIDNNLSDTVSVNH